MKNAFEKSYSISLSRLKQGKNEFSFTVNSEFFVHFPYSPVKDGLLSVELLIQKATSHLSADFYLKGYLMLDCDRCMEEMQYPIRFHQRVIYSFDEKMQESEDAEIVYVDETESELYFSQDIYDFVCISIPFRKVHEDIGLSCNPMVMKYILPPEEAESEKENDPRWDALKKLTE
jgi:uncharacterized metal-binding protein YceD (DUF177 family)